MNCGPGLKQIRVKKVDRESELVGTASLGASLSSSLCKPGAFNRDKLISLVLRSASSSCKGFDDSGGSSEALVEAGAEKGSGGISKSGVAGADSIGTSFVSGPLSFSGFGAGEVSISIFPAERATGRHWLLH